ncbi:MAG: hypothetical protein J0M15_13680 [Deltaproteobacteria bacterium]|nr:hypothetical protein [Deltaproteobacteria bacterium]
MNKSIFTTCLVLISAFATAQTTYPNERNEGLPAQTEGSSQPPTPATDNYNAASSNALNARTLSRGGFYIEPMILTTQEETSIKTSQLPFITNDTTGTSRGYGVGLRFGGHFNEMVLLGIDARYSKIQANDSFYQQADSKAYDIAPMITIQTPYYGVRLLAGYVIVGENDPNAGYRDLDLKFKEASGLRVGAGVFVSSVGINLEYQDISYNSTEIQSLGSYSLNKVSAVDAKNRGYALSLSFPVEL